MYWKACSMAKSHRLLLGLWLDRSLFHLLLWSADGQTGEHTVISPIQCFGLPWASCSVRATYRWWNCFEIKIQG